MPDIAIMQSTTQVTRVANCSLTNNPAYTDISAPETKRCTATPRCLQLTVFNCYSKGIIITRQNNHINQDDTRG